MELKDFVCETMKGIIAGVEDAQKYAKEHGAIINPTKFGVVAPKAIMNYCCPIKFFESRKN